MSTRLRNISLLLHAGNVNTDYPNTKRKNRDFDQGLNLSNKLLRIYGFLFTGTGFFYV